MTRRPPELRDIVGDDLSFEERTRLGRVHELLVAADAPPELPDSLVALPSARPKVRFLERRRAAVLALAAALAVAAFVGGYLAADDGDAFETTRELAMRPTAEGGRAFATIELGERDANGNWPLRVTIRGLAPLPEGGYYDMYLTRRGKPVAPCGSFNIETRGGTTEIFLNAPYDLERFAGWVVTRHMPDDPHGRPGTVVLTT